MTGICAIYSCFAQTRQPILSLTSTAIRANTQIHVRRNSVLACAYDTSIVKPVVHSVRRVQAASKFFCADKFGGSILTVSTFLSWNSLQLDFDYLPKNKGKFH